MGAREVDEYVDCITGEQLLMTDLHPPLKLDSKGIMYEVKSKLIPLHSWSRDDEPKAIDLVSLYGLKHLDRINCLQMFDAYMNQYLKMLILRRPDRKQEQEQEDKEELERFRNKFNEALGDLGLRSRFSDFKFYTGWDSYGFLMLGEPFPGGTLVLSDTASQPPTFYYLALGIVGRPNPNVRRAVLKHSSPNMVLYSDREESSESEEEEEEGEEEETSDAAATLKSLPLDDEIEARKTSDAAERLKSILLNDDIYSPGPFGSHYMYDPARGTCYFGGVVDGKEPEIACSLIPWCI